MGVGEDGCPRREATRYRHAEEADVAPRRPPTPDTQPEGLLLALQIGTKTRRRMTQRRQQQRGEESARRDRQMQREYRWHRERLRGERSREQWRVVYAERKTRRYAETRTQRGGERESRIVFSGSSLALCTSMLRLSPELYRRALFSHHRPQTCPLRHNGCLAGFLYLPERNTGCMLF